MRTDVARILTSMGYVPLTDFIAQEMGGVTTLVWLAQSAQPTEAQIDAAAAGASAALLVQEHARIVAKLTNGDVNAKLVRGVLLVILDEMNAHAATITAILNAVDGAASLAALKTAIASIADQQQRTKQQLVTAITNKVNAGDADT